MLNEVFDRTGQLVNLSKFVNQDTYWINKDPKDEFSIHDQF